MRRTIKVISAAALMAAMMAVSALPALAHGPDVRPHQHFVVTPNGEQVAVGPGVCANPQTQEGFNHFHSNVHRGTPSLEAFQQENNPVGFTAAGCPL